MLALSLLSLVVTSATLQNRNQEWDTRYGAPPKSRSQSQQERRNLCHHPVSHPLPNSSSILGNRLVMSLDFAIRCGEMFSLPHLHGVISQHPSGRRAQQPLGTGVGQPGWAVHFSAMLVLPFCFWKVPQLPAVF